MSVINFNTGIEGYHIYEQGFKEKTQLPDTKNLAPQGERIKDHLQFYTKKFDRESSGADRAFRPNITNPNLLAPWGFLKAYNSTLTRLKRMRKKSTKNEQALDAVIELLETAGEDVELLNDYISCLQKV